jgi:hypothetical protein
MSDRKVKFSKQAWINLGNFLVALIALVLSFPTAVNQYQQFQRERAELPITRVVNYSPSHTDPEKAQSGDSCWGSIVSDRVDAYRCTTKNVLLDPCFIVEYLPFQPGTYFYCPDKLDISSKDKILSVSELNIERRHIESAEVDKEAKELPWLIVFHDGVSCRLASGAVGTAYGSKGNIYLCEDQKYMSVTEGYIKDERYYFDCKFKGKNIYENCVAKLVVY